MAPILADSQHTQTHAMILSNRLAAERADDVGCSAQAPGTPTYGKLEKPALYATHVTLYATHIRLEKNSLMRINKH
jgi:hypothetical protein